MGSNECKLQLYAFSVDCKDPLALADFYAALLGWEMPYHDEQYAIIAPVGAAQGTYPGITFQRNPDYRPPVWPGEPGAQQQMAHIDIAVDDLERAVALARSLGATLADTQFADGWRVLFDPAGHPFCLCLLGHVFPADE